MTLDGKCDDCGLDYEDFSKDTVLPDEHWLMIHPEGFWGLLCANCIVARAARLPDIIYVGMRFVFAADYDEGRANANEWLRITKAERRKQCHT